MTYRVLATDDLSAEAVDLLNAHPGFDFDALMAPVREKTDWMPLEQFVFDAASSQDYLIEANWALYCDNYLEEFHIPYVHGASLTGFRRRRIKTCWPSGTGQSMMVEYEGLAPWAPDRALPGIDGPPHNLEPGGLLRPNRSRRQLK